MAIFKRDIVDIELESGHIHRSWLKHSIGLKDQKADHFGVRVFRNKEAVSLTGVSVQGIFLPPQGSPIAITSGNIVSGNVAEVVLPQACYNYDGQFSLAIKLVDSTNSVTGTVRIVDGVVDNTHADGTVAPTGAVPTYQEILSVYDEMVAAKAGSVRFDISQSLTAAQKGQAQMNIDAAGVPKLAPPFSTSTSYIAGEYVTYEGRVYMCTSNHSGAWAAGHFTETSIGDQLTATQKMVAEMWSPSKQYQIGDCVFYGGKLYRWNEARGVGTLPESPYATEIAMANSVRDTQGMAAEMWSPSKTYQIGDYVVYKDVLWRWVQARGAGTVPESPYATAVKLGDDVSDLKSAISVAIDNGNTLIDKSVAWNNGYITISGTVMTSSVSGYAVVPLNKGETVRIGTRNTNITIIGSTTSDSVSVGDSVTVIQKTSATDRFEEYSYTATENIKIVLCVRKSEYKLHFEKKASEIIGLQSEIDNNITLVESGKSTRSGWNQGNAYKNGSAITFNDSTTRCHIILEKKHYIYKITAENGYNLSIYACTKNGTQYIWQATISDGIVEDYNDYYIVIACYKTNTSSDISPVEAQNNVKFVDHVNDRIDKLRENVDSLNLYSGVSEFHIDKWVSGSFYRNGSNIVFTTPTTRCRMFLDADDMKQNLIVKANPGYLMYVALCTYDNGQYVCYYTTGELVSYIDLSPYANKYCAWIAVKRTDESEFSSVSEARDNIIFSRRNAADTVYYLNSEKFTKIASLCRVQSRAAYSTKKYFVFAHITDTHAINKAVFRAIQCLNDCPDIDMLLHTGDIQRKTYYDEQVGYYSGAYENNIQDYTDAVKSSMKPVFTVLGNHDQNGNYATGYTDNPVTLQMLYDRFMKPMVDKAWLSAGTNIDDEEYATYYYKDFPEYGIRFIGLNCFDPLYDGFYTDKPRDDSVMKYSPSQITFLVNALLSVPTDYYVIVGLHYPCSIYTNSTAENSEWTSERINTLGYAVKNPILMDADPVMDILSAYKGKSSLTKTYTYTDDAVASRLGSVSVNADFTNANGTLVFIPTGHSHDDFIVKLTSHNDIKAVSMVGSILTEPDGDVGRGYTGAASEWTRNIMELETKMVGKPQDAINVYIVRTDIRKVYIIRLGADFTTDARDRIMTSIDF